MSAAALALLIATAPPTEIPCGPYEPMHEELAEVYGERIAFKGVTERGGTLVVYVNDVSQTWTALILIRDGTVACGLGSGQGARQFPATAY